MSLKTNIKQTDPNWQGLTGKKGGVQNNLHTAL